MTPPSLVLIRDPRLDVPRKGNLLIAGYPDAVPLAFSSM
jgi:hypothetical protein